MSLIPERVDVRETEQRELDLVATEEVERRKQFDVVEQYGLSGVLQEWVRYDPETVRRFCDILTTIDGGDYTSTRAIAEDADEPHGTVGPWMSDGDRLDSCTRKAEGVYELTPVGRKAVTTPWGEVFDALA